jgi:hypothetical protein
MVNEGRRKDHLRDEKLKGGGEWRGIDTGRNGEGRMDE